MAAADRLESLQAAAQGGGPKPGLVLSLSGGVRGGDSGR